MGLFQVPSLHSGMNLRDEPIAMDVGETGLSVGCDFSTQGHVKPMRKAKRIHRYDDDIIDAHIVYIKTEKYIFTTHASGLKVNGKIIDAAFTGIFKVLPINDQYVVLSCATRNRKWKPGWDDFTYEWGLNTPPVPTLSAITTDNDKSIDDFEDVSDWNYDGGSLEGDSTTYTEGSQSLKITIASGSETLTAKKESAHDLSYVNEADDLGINAYISFSLRCDPLEYVDSFKILFSCQDDGEITTDYYYMEISLSGGYDYATLVPTDGVLYPQTLTSQASSLTTLDTGSIVVSSSATAGKVTLSTYTRTSDTVPTAFDENGNPTSYDYANTTTDALLSTKEINYDQYNITSTTTNSFIANASWATIIMPITYFTRIGTADKDWSNITSVEFQVRSVNGGVTVNIDDLKIVGTGNLWGTYWVAVAYQNEFGNYGPYSAYSTPVELKAQKLLISGLTIDTDAQTTKRKMVILGGSMTRPFIFYLTNNTSTTYTYNYADGDLTSEEIYFNNRKPPLCSDMILTGGRVFMVGLTDYQNRMAYSETWLYEGFPYLNYRAVSGGERLHQVSAMNSVVYCRGEIGEYTTQLLGYDHSTWKTDPGAREGALGSRLLLDLGQGQVFFSRDGFYLSASGGIQKYYLPKINPVVDPDYEVFGSLVGQFAYVSLRTRANEKTGDTGTYYVLRIDYTSEKPVAHYVMNLRPTAIFSDRITKKVCYAYGSKIYEFDSGIGPLPVSLKIPSQYCNSRGQKDFVSLSYELEDNPLDVTYKVDRSVIKGSYSLPAGKYDTKSLPLMTGRGLEISLTTTDDFVLYLPIELEFVNVGR